MIETILKSKLPNQDPINYKGKAMNTTTFAATNGFAQKVFYVTVQESEGFSLVERNKSDPMIPIFDINKKSYMNNSYRLDPDFVIKLLLLTLYI